MKLIVLSDNRTNDETLKTEHGLCIHLDTGKIKVLLDTGASDVFIKNAAVLGIDLADVDYIFISHGHWDHAGGLGHILKINEKARVIISPEAIKGSFHSSRKGMHDISPSWPYELMNGRLICVDKETDIEGMRVIPDISCIHPLPKADKCLFRREDDGLYVPDDFRHEIVLKIGTFLFTGCAHNGLLNILESIQGQVTTVVGGFHLLDSTENEEFENDLKIRQLASDLLLKYPDTMFYTGHCTGDMTFKKMKDVIGSNLHKFTCGMSLETVIESKLL